MSDLVEQDRYKLVVHARGPHFSTDIELEVDSSELDDGLSLSESVFELVRISDFLFHRYKSESGYFEVRDDYVVARELRKIEVDGTSQLGVAVGPDWVDEGRINQDRNGDVTNG